MENVLPGMGPTLPGRLAGSTHGRKKGRGIFKETMILLGDGEFQPNAGHPWDGEDVFSVKTMIFSADDVFSVETMIFSADDDFQWRR